MSWDDFRYFLAAAESGSLSEAAKRLGSNQPTVGRHIDVLETALGLKLFQRHKRGLTLTNEGAGVLEQAQFMRSGVQNIQRMIEGDYQQLQGSVRLALPEGLCNEIIIPRLESFYQQYPNLRLILNVSSRTANLTRGEADIAIRLFRPKEGDLVTRQLSLMEMGLFASPEYLQTHGQPESASDLLQHRVISYGDELAGLPENKWLLDHVAPDSRMLQSDSTATRLKATVCGLGISIQPCMFASANPNLVRILKNTPISTHEIWITYHRDLRDVLRIRVTVDFLCQLFGVSGGSHDLPVKQNTQARQRTHTDMALPYLGANFN
ncbi:MAG: LysR family transcriptional regulator [Sulfuricellaceae bacterium]|nr:LysR family transcriptional regulator [Sulfuricellaceae bacterium]